MNSDGVPVSSSVPNTVPRIVPRRVRHFAAACVAGALAGALAGESIASTGGNQLQNASFEAVGPDGPFTTFTGISGGGHAAADGWGVFNNTFGTTITELVPSTLGGAGARMMRVRTDGGANGVGQSFGPFGTGPACVESGIWVYVVTGRMYIGAGNGGNTGPNVFSTTTGVWEFISGENLVCPANNFIIYSEPAADECEFFVELASVDPFECQGPAGDLDQDGTVGFTDLIILLSSWGPCEGDCPADLDGDGRVGFTDVVLLLHTWGECEAP